MRNVIGVVRIRATAAHPSGGTRMIARVVQNGFQVGERVKCR